MGDYATTTSFSELLPFGMAGDTTTSDTAGANIFSRHIDRAEGVVNSYITARYSLPFVVGTTTTDVPPLVRKLSEDIATFNYLRGVYSQDGEIKQEYVDAYDRAYSTLEDIRDGKTKLAATDGSQVATKSSIRYLSSTENYSHVYNLDEPKTWKVDKDQVDDMNDARK